MTARPDTAVVDTSHSVVRWVGTKFGGRGAHAGRLRLLGGHLVWDGATLRTAHVVIDMRSLAITDIPLADASPRRRLLAHLVDEDFLAVTRFPTATFVLDRAVPAGGAVLRCDGRLTMRGVTQPVRVDATVWSHEPTARHATARLAIDRTKWGITFRGGVLTNDLIDDTVRLELEIVARVRRAAAGAASAHVVRPSPGSVRTTLASARTAQAAPAPADAPRTAAAQARREPVIGEPCEGCEGIFDGRPTAPPPIARLAPIGEPGAPLLLHGTVRDTTGRPVPGTIVYAYHTNARGIYPLDDLMRGRAAYHHGTLRGWARTDGAGRYAFETIRPAHYPRTTLPEHVHLHVIEPGRCTYYIDDVMFTDDPHLTPAQRRQLVAGRGGSGVVRPVRDASGRWVAVRDIVLGQGIPGYERCDRR